MTSLAFLSIARVGHRKIPHVPDNTERLQAYRRFAPVQFANVQLPRPSPSPNHNPKSAGRRLLSSEAKR